MSIQLLKKQLGNIQQPLTFEQITEEYLSGEYNAEILLQHCLLHIIKTQESSNPYCEKQTKFRKDLSLDRGIYSLLQQLKDT